MVLNLIFFYQYHSENICLSKYHHMMLKCSSVHLTQFPILFIDRHSTHSHTEGKSIPTNNIKKNYSIALYPDDWYFLSNGQMYCTYTVLQAYIRNRCIVDFKHSLVTSAASQCKQPTSVTDILWLRTTSIRSPIKT